MKRAKKTSFTHWFDKELSKDRAFRQKVEEAMNEMEIEQGLIHGRSASAETSGERGLMLEIMEHTRRGLAKRPGSEVRRECERWLKEREPDRAFSFEWICEVFGWNPEEWRREMLAAAGRNGGTRKVWRRLAHKRIERRRERR